MPNQQTQPNSEVMHVGGNAGARLKAIVERIERTQEDIDAAKEDQKEIYAEAKGVGFDVKILRKVVARRKMEREKIDEEAALIDVYEKALTELNKMME
jgi:uncharacterized protein (UPF0335 family)